ncbi:MAG TPA: PorP/SprF family type IX secretion system membrane protein [Bacteroidia bacterium]|nr:PorP/SprF family type IX secretion system membrane protein [Bacteroidia bacterium]
MIKRFTVALGLLVSTLAANAQQDPYYSHFMLNKVAYNPGTAGLKDAICVNVLGHQQWMGVNNGDELTYITPSGQTLERQSVGPKTYFASVTAPVSLLHGGASLVFMSDALGYERTVNVKAGYAFHLNLDRASRLQVGFDVGLLQKEFDGRYYNPRNPNDPLIPTGQTSGRTFDLGFGANYFNDNLAFLNVGISATHLLGGKVTYMVGNTPQDVAIARNIYVHASTAHPLASGLVILEPNVWIKTIFATTQFDLNCRALIQQKYVAGLTYRDGGNSTFLDAFSLQLGYYFQPNFYVGYAYDVPITRGLAGGGTHEIFASYCFNITPPPPVVRWIIDPRHLGGYR